MTNIKFTKGSKLTTLQPNTTSSDVTITLPNKNGKLVTLDDLNQAISEYDNNNKNNTINMKNLQQIYTVLTQSVLKYTIGSNGDFETLTEALNYFCRVKVVLNKVGTFTTCLKASTSHSVELTIKSGYKIESVSFQNVDLSHVLIMQEDINTAMRVKPNTDVASYLFSFMSCKTPVLAKLNIEAKVGEGVVGFAYYSTNSTGILVAITFKCVYTDGMLYGILCEIHSRIIIIGIDIDLKFIITKDTFRWYNPGRALNVSEGATVNLITSNDQYINKKRFAVTVEYTNGKKDTQVMEWCVIRVNGNGAVVNCSSRLEVYFNGTDASMRATLLLVRHSCSLYGYDSIIVTAMNIGYLVIACAYDASRLFYIMCGDEAHLTKITLTNITSGWRLTWQNGNSLVFVRFNEVTYNTYIKATNANRIEWARIAQNQFTEHGIFM